MFSTCPVLPCQPEPCAQHMAFRLQSPSAGLGSAVLWSLAVLEGAGLCGCFHFYSISPECGTTGDGEQVKLYPPSFPQLVAGSSVGCQGARKAAVKKLPGTVALEVPGHGSSKHGKATSLTGGQLRNFSSPSGAFGQETAGGTGSTRRQGSLKGISHYCCI